MADEEKDPAQAFQSRLDKFNGDAMAFARQLYDDNYRLREKNRELEGKVPAEGARVLNKAEAARFEAYEALKKKPEDIAAALTQAEKDTAEAEKLRRKDKLRDVADVGFGGSRLKLSVLEKLDGEFTEERPEYDIRDDGKGGKAVHVKHGGKELPLEQFAKETWADFVPALKAEAGQQQRRGGNGGDPPPAGTANFFDTIRERVKGSREKEPATARTLSQVAGRPS